MGSNKILLFTEFTAILRAVLLPFSNDIISFTLFFTLGLNLNQWLRLEIASELLKLKKGPWKFTLRSSEIPKYLQEGICLEAVHLGYLLRKRQPVLPRHFSLTETELHQPVYRAIF